MVERNEQGVSVSNPHLLALSNVWAEAVKEHRRKWRGHEDLIINPSPISAIWVRKTARELNVIRNLQRSLYEKIAELVEQSCHEAKAITPFDSFQNFEDRVVKLSQQLKTYGAPTQQLVACSKFLWFAWPEAGFVYDSHVRIVLKILGKDMTAGNEPRWKKSEPAENDFRTTSKRFKTLFLPFLKVIQERVLRHELNAMRIIDKALWLAGDTWIATAGRLAIEHHDDLGKKDKELGNEIASEWDAFVRARSWESGQRSESA
jgi:hypothetical protein